MSDTSAAEQWRTLDPGAEPMVTWPRPCPDRKVAILLGAFDPPTNAHLAVIVGASRVIGAHPAICMTKVLLARPGDGLLDAEIRVDVLDEIAARSGLGFALANRGTYLEVGRCLKEQGIDVTFVVGADKVDQLADPSFYPDGGSGVAATFDELSFAVVPRGGVDLSTHAGRVLVLDRDEIFEVAEMASVTATEVRSRLRNGEPVDDLVPPEVALVLRGYTRSR